MPAYIDLKQLFIIGRGNVNAPVHCSETTDSLLVEECECPRTLF